MKICFYPQSCVPVEADTLEKRPLGGTETGIIRISEALAKMGHEVTVFTSIENPKSSNVQYLEYKHANKLKMQDVFISIREWFPLVRTAPARLRYFWTGDAGNQIHTVGIGDKRVVSAIDRILAVSNWQAKHLNRVSGYPLEKFCVIGNGIHLPYFNQSVKKDPYKIIYSTTPFRGLVYLPLIFENIRKIEPRATLDIYSGIDVYKSSNTEHENNKIQEQYSKVFEKLHSMDGVSVIGNVTQARLAKGFQQASIHCYPNNFAETSCITAMEAQAGGAVNVTTALGALPETLGEAGVIVNSKPGTKEFIENFIKGCLYLFDNPDTQKSLREKGHKLVKEKNNWEAVAKRFETQLINDLNLPEVKTRKTLNTQDKPKVNEKTNMTTGSKLLSKPTPKATANKTETQTQSSEKNKIPVNIKTDLKNLRSF